jgi:hypothetical protein
MSLRFHLSSGVNMTQISQVAITGTCNAHTGLHQPIPQLHSQVQNLLPPSANFIPPGWNAEVWEKLPHRINTTSGFYSAVVTFNQAIEKL